MLCMRHFYYRIFHAHKPVIRTFSCWPNPPIIFGTQFSQIPNRNGHCNILFKSQELCQRNQFCSGIDGKINDHLILATQFLKLDIYNRRKLRLKLEKGRSGQKFFRISLKNQNPGKYINFPNILVPQEIYSLIRAFDELIGELAAENFGQKLLQIKGFCQKIHNLSQSLYKNYINLAVKLDSSKSIIEASNDRKTLNILKLRTVELDGKHQKFELELLFFPNQNQMKGQKQICLGLCTIHKITKKGGIMTLPLQALPWLRNQMAEMLAKFDGTEEIKKAAAQIPEKFFDIVVTPTLPPPLPNGNSYRHRLNQNGMRPQFVNQRTAYFQQYPKMVNINQNSNQNGVKNQRRMLTPLTVQQRQTLKQSEVKKTVKNRTEHLDRQIVALERGIQTLFDFDEEEMEKYRRIAAKTKNPPKH